MSIQFDQLPQDNPYAMPAVGLYKAKITDVEMKTPKPDANGFIKPDYLNIKLTLFDKNNKNCGSIYDSISESESSVVQYKIARFIRAVGLPMVGAMELRDIAKLIKGKEIAVDVSHSKETEKYKPKAQVEVFAHEAYYLASEFETELALRSTDAAQPDGSVINQDVSGNDEEIPFDAQDGVASTPSSATY